MVGDDRWAGAYGVTADFIAMTHCSVEFIPLAQIQVKTIETREINERELLI